MIADFPRSEAYLKGMRINPREAGLTDQHLAMILADAAFTDETLVEDGRVDFKANDGTTNLGILDELLRARRQRPTDADLEALKAFIGSRGIKASRCKTDDDFWLVATTLWPSHVKRSKGHSLVDLLRQIRAMSKKDRQGGTERKKHLPARFFGTFDESAA